jgi:hypothetical protein
MAHRPPSGRPAAGAQRAFDAFVGATFGHTPLVVYPNLGYSILG